MCYKSRNDLTEDLIHKVLNGYENHLGDKITDDKGLTGS